MAITRVNSSAITGSGTTASAYTAALGVAVLAGDLIVVTANCNGTHATNGMSCTETSTSTALTTISETDQGGSSTRWLQTFYLYVTNDIASGTISLTPYAGNTASSMSVDIFRGTAGTISRAVQTVSGVSGTTANTPALSSAPPAGDLVLSLVSVSSGTATQPAAYTAGSTTATNVRTANAYVLSADGSSTYGGTWTWGTTNTSALQTVSFAANTSPVVAAVASANSNSAGYPVSVPTGTANGDLLVGVVASDFGTFAGNSFGTGWTELTTSEYNGGTNAFHIGLWARIAASEPASYTVSHDSSDSVAAILRVTGWDSASGIAGAVKQVAPSITGTGTTAPSIVPNGSNDLLLTFHGAETSAGGARTWTPPSGMTERVDRQSTTWTALEVCSLNNPSNPSGTKVATPSASVDTGAACTLSIKAPGTGGGSAILAATATLSAAGSVAAGASLASTATLSASGSVVFTGGAASPITAGLTSTGTATGNPALTVTAGLSAAGAVTGTNSATLAITSSANATGTASGGVSSSITAGLAATGNVATSSGATLAVTASLSAISGGGTSAGAALSAATSLVAAGTTSAGAALAVTVTSAAGGVVPGGASLTTVASLVAAGAVGRSSGASSTFTAAFAAAGGTSGIASMAVTATVTAAGAVGATGFNGTATSVVTATCTAAGVVGRTSGAASNITVTLTASGSANLQRTGSLLVTAVIAAAGINNSTQLGTANAAIMPVPAASGASLPEPSSSAGSMGVPTASGG